MGRDGDEEFRRWALSSRPRLRRTAFLLCGDSHLADDLVQDTLTRIFQVWHRVSGSGDPSAYARRILVNRYVDHHRRGSRREVLTADVPDRAADREGDAEHRRLLLAALSDVPAGQRAVLVLRFWEDLSVEQTAQLLQTSEGNVKSQTSRGLVALRAALASRGVTSPVIVEDPT